MQAASEHIKCVKLILIYWFLQCARDGIADDMRRLIGSIQGNVKKKINAHDDEDLSALHYAARYNHVEICKLLVEAGASTKNCQPPTILYY